MCLRSPAIITFVIIINAKCNSIVDFRYTASIEKTKRDKTVIMKSFNQQLTSSIHFSTNIFVVVVAVVAEHFKLQTNPLSSRSHIAFESYIFLRDAANCLCLSFIGVVLPLQMHDKNSTWMQQKKAFIICVALTKDIYRYIMLHCN